MLTTNSILKRLPGGIDQRDLILLDGVRFSAEIAWVGFCRLEHLLTTLVDSPPDARTDDAHVQALLDAWAVVDSVDRFRQVLGEPGLAALADPSALASFDQAARPIRSIRNVTAHLAQRADYVAAHGNPVLGLLTWVTFPADTRAKIFTCALAPGTRKKIHWTLVNPAGECITSHATGRTGLIHLAAGSERASLSTAIDAMRECVHSVERALERVIAATGAEGQQAGGSYFLALLGDLGSANPDIGEG